MSPNAEIMETEEIRLKEDCEVLMLASVPEIYKVNGFRISGLNVNSSTREITTQLDKYQKLEKYGIKSAQVSSPFPISPEPDTDQRRQALHRLRDPETRIIDELFWFWPNSLDNSQNDDALAALSKNDIKSAESAWISAEANFTESNVSRHNLAILSHLQVLDIELNGGSLSESEITKRNKLWKDTYKRWKLLFDHEGFWSRLTARVRQLDDPRLTTGFVRRLRESLPQAILQINALLALRAAENGNMTEAKRQLKILYDSGLDNQVCLAALKRVVDPIRNRIKIICKSASDKTYTDTKEQLAAARNVIGQTGALLNTLDVLLPGDSVIREGAHDEIALAAVNLAITYANKIEDWEGVLPVFEDCTKIVTGESARQRVEKNYDIFRSNIEFDRIHNTCFFCGKNKANPGSAVKKAMHGNITVNQEYDKYSRRVQVTRWNHNTIEVPRCAICEKKHKHKGGAITRAYYMGFLGLFLGAVLAGMVDYRFSLLCLITMTLAGIYAGYKIEVRKGYTKEIRKMRTRGFGYYKKFPRIKEYLKQGWTWGENPPNQ